jgi:hypothetical protein
MLEFLMKSLLSSNNFAQRRAFIWFCKHVITLIPFQMFKDIFSDHLMGMHTDPIPRVRQDLAEALITIKPFFDRSEEEAYIITELLQTMIQDKHPEVSDCAEHSEIEILNSRKKYNQKDMQQ